MAIYLLWERVWKSIRKHRPGLWSTSMANAPYDGWLMPQPRRFFVGCPPCRLSSDFAFRVFYSPLMLGINHLSGICRPSRELAKKYRMKFVPAPRFETSGILQYQYSSPVVRAKMKDDQLYNVGYLWAWWFRLAFLPEVTYTSLDPGFGECREEST